MAQPILPARPTPRVQPVNPRNPPDSAKALVWLAGGLMVIGALGFSFYVSLIGLLFMLVGIGVLVLPFVALPWWLIIRSWRGSTISSLLLMVGGMLTVSGYYSYFGLIVPSDGTMWGWIPICCGIMTLGAALMLIVQLIVSAQPMGQNGDAVSSTK